MFGFCETILSEPRLKTAECHKIVFHFRISSFITAVWIGLENKTIKPKYNNNQKPQTSWQVGSGGGLEMEVGAVGGGGGGRWGRWEVWAVGGVGGGGGEGMELGECTAEVQVSHCHR